MPAVSSAGETGILRKVPQGGAVEALVVVDGAVADELHLGHAGDGLEVWMEDGLCGGLGFIIAMSI